MALLNSGIVTLYDRIQAMDPDGAIAPIAEMLTQKNPILRHIHFREANMTTGHRFVSRTGLPSLTWRKFNQGITSSKSRRDQHDETIGMLAGRSEVDVDLVELNGDGEAFRQDEDMSQIAAMNNEVATGLFYHSTVTNPEKFMGLSARFAATAGNPASAQIIKHTAGAAGNDQNSLWLVCWGPDTVFGIYPKGSRGGIVTKDMGEQYVTDANSNRYLAKVTDFKWKVGLVVKDWRYVVRVCNIDTSAISPTNDDIVPAMIDAVSQCFDLETGVPAFYCNRFVYRTLWKQARNKVANSTLQWDQVEGRPVLNLMGVNIYQVDALNSAEAVIV